MSSAMASHARVYPGTSIPPTRTVPTARRSSAAQDGDRHQFRFIVSSEDGCEYDDLKPLTRRLMAQVEQDLGTKFDWVTVDHYNTGRPTATSFCAARTIAAPTSSSRANI
jgi:type IV secretory pathway VirD2 relaxase